MPILAPAPASVPLPPGLPDPATQQVRANVYTYTATDLITGRVLADTLPLTVSQFSRQLSGAGQLTGSLSLQTDQAINQPYVAALEASRCMLWVKQNGFPVWAGVVWDWPHTTLQPPATLPIQAQTIESLFDHRMITDTLDYAQVDMFTVFNDLVVYGTSKNSPFITSLSPAANRLPASVIARMRVAGLVVDNSSTAGVPWSATYAYSDYRKVSDVWTDLINGGDFEYTFEPGLDADGNLAIFVRLGYTQLGRPAAASNLVLSYPGNVIDYGYPRTGSQSANVIWATAPPNGNSVAWQSVYPHGFDQTELDAGYPLLEDTVSWNGSTVTQQAQVDQFADSQVQLRTGQMTLPQLVIGGAGQPATQEIILGDWAWFTATSPLHPPRGSEPGLVVPVRIAGWQCTPPGQNQAEQLVVSSSGVFANDTTGG
ncbi:MAG: hypothetical protein JWO67_3810 [Streptosporangiaceae bacterium]|nr:hypothetical protein [Streptosporangiaceae bacterium]